jgi:hypothetical protein
MRQVYFIKTVSFSTIGNIIFYLIAYSPPHVACVQVQAHGQILQPWSMVIKHKKHVNYWNLTRHQSYGNVKGQLYFKLIMIS